jgi:hypothetical protein
MKEETWNFVTRRLVSITGATKEDISLYEQEKKIIIEDILKEVNDKHRLVALIEVEKREEKAVVKQSYEYREKISDGWSRRSQYLKNKYIEDTKGKIVADARYCLRDAGFDLDQMNIRWDHLSNEEVSEERLRDLLGEVE